MLLLLITRKSIAGLGTSVAQWTSDAPSYIRMNFARFVRFGSTVCYSMLPNATAPSRTRACAGCAQRTHDEHVARPAPWRLVTG